MFFIPYGTREDQPRRHFPIVTVLLVLLNIAVFIYEAMLLAQFGGIGLDAFLGQYAVIPADIFDGTPLEISLLTAMFIHGGLLHILSNMIFLLPFGDNVEDRLGRVRYLFFYLACGLIASVVYSAFNANSLTPLVGASGAIAGVLAGYLALHPRGRVKGLFFFFIILFPITLPAFVFIGYWFITQIFSSVASFGAGAASDAGGVAFLAHVAGFLAGLVLAPLLAPKEQRQSALHELRT
ncbi:MAG TPA: rhomboid family intramembrane serine protease [Candidatus Limnocylindrales bacterium]|nr:rhomboid family intramembrane serine protease [Candidatus Limnocylindrales bacterium]